MNKFPATKPNQGEKMKIYLRYLRANIFGADSIGSDKDVKKGPPIKDVLHYPEE